MPTPPKYLQDNKNQRNRPAYGDGTTALKFLVDGMDKLGRLDDIVRHVEDRMGKEIEALSGNERVWVFTKAEIERAVGVGGGELKRVRNFIFRLCNDFIDVALRTSYLVQIVRDKKYGSEDKGIDDGGERVRGERKLKSLVEGAVGIMQGEVEKLIRAVLGE